MEKELFTFDITDDFIAGDRITKETLNKYSRLPHKIKAGWFLLCVEGSVQASINLTRYTIKKYDFVTLVPSNFIQFHEVSDDVRFYFARFSSEFMTNIHFIKSSMSILPVIAEHPVMPLEESVAQLYIDGYRLLIRARSLSPSAATVNKNLVIAYLTIFMQGTAELYKNQSHWTNGVRTRTHEIYRKFIELVVAHYTAEHGVSFYAAQLNLSLPHFCTTIKKAIGLTPLEIISSIITMDAKAQLRSTDLSVKEIAFSLGFNNLSFFNKYFRQHTGVTPQEYRRMKIPPSL
ncbi:AraC family transcriptional regulator [Parabacteroides sp. ZJ-118]|uniref:AraC family transcriptional regulator n=1 Tax=Parabacteroides sp. ZJ-118 TaxID=2709398 RepID=UPI0013EC44F7|nr:helix-turn-helix domain-containing protein [Parabacteroides sp. ZJ-118]